MKEYISKKYEIVARLQLRGKHFEFWLPIKDFPNYEVSTEGRIRNRKTEKLLALKDGCLVHLFKNGKSSNTYERVSKIVVETFIKKNVRIDAIIHIDGNKKNNCLSNLDYFENQRNKKELEFKPIPHYANYLINKCGDIFSTKYEMKKKTICNNGYLQVSLMCGKSKNRHFKQLLVHRLVAETFIPNPHNLPQVNHINGIKTDNRVENLEWCTRTDNWEHAQKMNLLSHGSKHHSSKLKEEYIPWIKKMSKAGISYSKIAKVYDVSDTAIRLILNDKTWKHC